LEPDVPTWRPTHIGRRGDDFTHDGAGHSGRRDRPGRRIGRARRLDAGRAAAAGPISTITTAPRQLVAVALPDAARRSGLVWRIARRYDSRVVREVSEADVGSNVVIVYKVVGRGRTSLVFALTRGDTSAKAVKAITHRVVSR
jgi:hypothetical protein